MCRGLLSSTLIAVATCAEIEAADDVWVAGRRLASWQRVEAIQQYPLFADAPDWKSSCADPNPEVRAAACLAIARSRLDELAPYVVPLLNDPWPLTREWAQWTLQHMKQGETKTVLVSSLPAEVRSRVQTPPDPRHYNGFGNEFTRLAHSLQHSQIDGGDPIVCRVRVSQEGGTSFAGGQLVDHPMMFTALDPQDERFQTDWSDIRYFMAGHPDSAPDPGVVYVQPFELRQFHFKIPTKGRSLPPGTYLVNALYAEVPLLLRITRSREDQRQIEDLLSKPLAPQYAEYLAKQRVGDAVPMLIDLFQRNTGKNNFGVAKALARLGDPSAIDILLEHPRMRDHDLVGDTSESLRMFGEKAFPHYEKWILNWKERLAEENFDSLGISLRLLGTNGSDRVDRAQLELVSTLATAGKDYAAENRYGELQMFESATKNVAARHSTQAVETIWATVGSRQTYDRLIGSIRSWPAQVAEPVVRGLWDKSLPATEHGKGELIRLVGQFAPDLLVGNPAPFASESEALETLDQSIARDMNRDDAVRRARKFLETNASASVRLRLGRLLFLTKQMAEAETVLKEAVDECKAEGEKMEALWFLSEISLQRGDYAVTQEIVERAIAMAKPDAARPAHLPDRFQTRLNELLSSPKDADLAYQCRHKEMPADAPVAEGLFFYVREPGKVARYDPLLDRETTVPILARPVKTFAPFRTESIVVAYADQTLACFDEEIATPSWTREMPIRDQPAPRIGPHTILVTDAKGLMHCLDTTLGRTIWSFDPEISERTKPWSGIVHADFDTYVVQGGRESARTVRCLDALGGIENWSYLCPFGVDTLVVGERWLVVAGETGDMAMVWRDGNFGWKKRIEAFISKEGKAVATSNQVYVVPVEGGGWPTPVPDQRRETDTATPSASGQDRNPTLSVAIHGNDVIYFALRDQLVALQGSSGLPLWTRQWRPANGTDAGQITVRPLVHPTPYGLFWIVNWRTDGSVEEHTDVLFLTANGTVAAHKSSPLLDVRMPKIDGLTFYRQTIPSRQIPVLFITGDRNCFLEEAADLWKEHVTVGTTDILYKPFSSLELVYRKVESLIGRSQVDDASDLHINRLVRQVLASRWIDLGKQLIHTEDGIVHLQKHMWRLSKPPVLLDESAASEILTEIERLPNVRDVVSDSAV